MVDFENESLQYLKENESELIAEYHKNFGNVLDTDNARGLFRPIGYNGTNASDFQKASSQLIEKIFDNFLSYSENPKECLFIVGLPGSGKTTAVELIAGEKDSFVFIYDGVFSTKNDLNNKINKCLDRNFNVSVIFVYTNPYTAWRNILRRVSKTNRVVPADYFTKACGTYKDILNDLKTIPRNQISLIFIDNNGDISEIQEVGIEKTDDFEYTIEPDEVEVITETFYNDQLINEEQRNRINKRT